MLTTPASAIAIEHVDALEAQQAPRFSVVLARAIRSCVSAECR